jgi:hypothetical protein
MMPKIVNDPRFAACYRGFPDLESSNLKYLVLISSCLARDGLSRFAARTLKSAGFPLQTGLRSPG